MNDEVSKKSRIYCNWCKHETNHELTGEHRADFYEREIGFSETLIHRLWICMGCEHGLLQQLYTSDADPEGEYQYFPERSQTALVPKPYSTLKPTLTAIYTEAITCYNGKAPILCTAGLRALLEGICQDKKVKGKNLKAKIENLRPLLPNKNIIRNLHHFRFMGNDAVHELEAPKPKELALAIGVIEDLLNFFYELDYKAFQLQLMRQNRKPKVVKPAKQFPRP
jgi:uncharacterized protein DUF4145